MSIISTSITTTSATSIYTSATQTACTVIYLCNTTSSTVTVTINVGPTATASNTIYKLLAINGNDTYVINSERLTFDIGDRIYVTASAANAIVTTVSYLEI
jgi:hypothetical protein